MKSIVAGSRGMYEYAEKKGLKVHAVWLYS